MSRYPCHGTRSLKVQVGLLCNLMQLFSKKRNQNTQDVKIQEKVTKQTTPIYNSVYWASLAAERMHIHANFQHTKTLTARMGIVSLAGGYVGRRES